VNAPLLLLAQKRNPSSTFFWLVYRLEGERGLPSG
jgi:hypothetical protein